MKPSILCLFLVSACHLVTWPPRQARADGGTVRLAGQKGNYRITVFTAPAPVRAGPVDVSVLVQEAVTGEQASGVRVTIKAVPQNASAGGTFSLPATKGAATNKLYYAANIELPEPGWYTLEVSIDGPLGRERVSFELEVGEPAPPWLAVWPWVAWPALVVLLFGIHLFLVRCQARSSPGTMKDVPPRPANGLPRP
jgi:hypothetical protein